MITILLLMQVVSDVPVAKTEVVTEVTRRSLDIPVSVEDAMRPYLGCMTTGFNGVSVSSARQALEINAQSKARCAETRNRAREAAITSLKRKSGLSQNDIALFVEAVLAGIDDFTDQARGWCDQ